MSTTTRYKKKYQKSRAGSKMLTALETDHSVGPNDLQKSQQSAKKSKPICQKIWYVLKKTRTGGTYRISLSSS